MRPSVVLVAALVLFVLAGLVSADDGAALMTLKSFLGQPDALKSWVAGMDPCLAPGWFGITCTNSGRVSTIELRNMGLGGSIPSSLGDLSELTVLNLQNNALTGPLPRALTTTKLTYINLSGNMFSDSILSEFAQLGSLQYLFLDHNHFSGVIPGSLAQLPNLKALNFSFNQLVGSIPSELGNIASLQYIYLSSNLLSGSIPKSLAQMKNLQYLVLANNSLSGTIPDDFASASNLQLLDVSNNKLRGSVPAVKGTFLWSGNKDLTATSSTSTWNIDIPYIGERDARTVIIVAGGAGLLILLMVLACIVCCMCKAKRNRKGARKPLFRSKTSSLAYTRQKSTSSDAMSDMSASWKTYHVSEFAYAELQKATRNFGPDNESNQGPSGTLFWGVLSDGTTVTIKRVPTGTSKSSKAAFQKKRSLLCQLMHPNLASVLGYCAQQQEHLMVFERPANGTLRGHLSGPLARKDPIDWSHRFQAALGLAGALTYLHKEVSDDAVVHGEINSSNILLDKELQAKLSTLQLCKAANDDLDYLELEEGRRSPDQLSTPASDVHAFGLVLLELFTGNSRRDNEHLILDWARPLLDLDRVSAEMDRQIASDTSLEALQKLAHAALRCLAPSQKIRPPIEDIYAELKVANALHQCAAGHLVPRAPLKNEASEASKAIQSSKLPPGKVIAEPKMSLLDMDVIPRTNLRLEAIPTPIPPVKPQAEAPVKPLTELPTNENLARVAEKLRGGGIEAEATGGASATSLGVQGVPGLSSPGKMSLGVDGVPRRTSPPHRLSPGSTRATQMYMNPFGDQETWKDLNAGLTGQDFRDKAKPAWMLD